MYNVHSLSDGLEMHALPYNQVHISVLAIIVAGKNIREQQEATLVVLEMVTVVDLTTESASFLASTLAHSGGTLF